MKKSTVLFLYIVALIGGIGCAYLQYFFENNYGWPRENITNIWFQWCYPVFVLLSFVIPWIGTVAPWKWVLCVFFSEYLTTLAMTGGQIPPFEILFTLVMAIPCIVAGYLATFLKQKFWQGEGRVSLR